MQELNTKIADAVAERFDVDVEPEWSRPDPKLGDVSTNLALQLAGKLTQPPRQIAEALAARLESLEAVASVEVAGPGFINVRFATAALVDSLEQRPALIREGQTIVCETNNPNPFKAIHIGHAMNAIVADTIANLLDVSGGHVYRVSYHGDVGLHVGKSMYSLLRYVDGDITRLTDIPEGERNSFMSRMYADGSRAYKEDETAKKEIDELTRQSFTRQDPLYAQVYEACKTWSLQTIDEKAIQLGNKPTVRRFLESDADARGVPIVEKHTPGVFEKSDGALVFPGSKYGSFDNVYVTSRGLGLYGARDLGLMELKREQFHPDKSYIVTAEEQRDYFKGVIAAAGLIWPDQKDVTVNISTGLVKLSTGKMSSRSGEVVEIAWLFDQVGQAIRARGGEPSDELIAGALRYQFLKNRIGGDIIFDINEAVSISGSSGSYLQYAHARACSILAKSEEDDLTLPDSELEPDERNLLLKMSEYAEVISRAMRDLAPHLICTYLYELAQEFNRFYEKNRVIGDERQAQRLWLVNQYRQHLERGLAVLGIHAPERM